MRRGKQNAPKVPRPGSTCKSAQDSEAVEDPYFVPGLLPSGCGFEATLDVEHLAPFESGFTTDPGQIHSDVKDWVADYRVLRTGARIGMIDRSRFESFLRWGKWLYMAVVDSSLEDAVRVLRDSFVSLKAICYDGDDVLVRELASLPDLNWDAVRSSLENWERRIEYELSVKSPPNRPNVVLREAHEQPVVCGKEKPKLTTPRYHVVKALLDAGPNGLTKDWLVNKSGHTDAIGILKRLAVSDRDWGQVIHLAGTTGRRYRIL